MLEQEHKKKPNWGLRFIVLMLLVIGAERYLSTRPKPVHFKEPERVAIPSECNGKVCGIPVELQLGSRRFSVPADYINRRLWPYKGQEFTLELAWPSMKSYLEVGLNAKKTNDKAFRWIADSLAITVHPVREYRMVENYTTYYVQRNRIGGSNWPIEQIEAIGLYKMTSIGMEMYWPIDPSIRTPIQGNPYMFDCDKGDETNLRITCSTGFQLFPDIWIHVQFNKANLQDWKSMFYKVQDFIKSTDEKQP